MSRPENRQLPTFDVFMAIIKGLGLLVLRTFGGLGSLSYLKGLYRGLHVEYIGLIYGEYLELNYRSKEPHYNHKAPTTSIIGSGSYRPYHGPVARYLGNWELYGEVIVFWPVHILNSSRDLSTGLVVDRSSVTGVSCVSQQGVGGYLWEWFND